MDPRQVQIQTAQQNPNILSPLYGASPPTEFTNTLAQRAETQPTPQAAYQEAGKVGQEMAGRLYGTGNLQGMASNWDQAIQELARYDVMKEQQLIPNGQQVFTPGYVPNPVDQANFIGAMGSNVAGGIQTTGSAVSSINTAYQNAINNVINKFLDFYQIAEDRREKEATRKAQEEQNRLDWLLRRLGLTGGEMKDPYTGEVIRVQSPEEKAQSEQARALERIREQQRVESSATERVRTTEQNIRNQVTQDARNGMNQDELYRKYRGQLDTSELYRIYVDNSPYSQERIRQGLSPIVETPEQMQERFGVTMRSEEQTANLDEARKGLVEDTYEAKGRNMDRNEFLNGAKISYSELQSTDVENIVNQLWPLPTSSAQPTSSWFQNLINTLKQPSSPLPGIRA